jgi:hypothetical protein
MSQLQAIGLHQERRRLVTKVAMSVMVVMACAVVLPALLKWASVGQRTKQFGDGTDDLIARIHQRWKPVRPPLEAGPGNDSDPLFLGPHDNRDREWWFLHNSRPLEVTVDKSMLRNRGRDRPRHRCLPTTRAHTRLGATGRRPSHDRMAEEDEKEDAKPLPAEEKPSGPPPSDLRDPGRLVRQSHQTTDFQHIPRRRPEAPPERNN